MKRIVVTGSAGFVGSHLVRALVKRGDQVVTLDRKTGTDLSEPGFDLAAFSWPPDAIVHLASTCSTPGSVRDPVATFRDTVVTAVHVLEAAREHWTPVILTTSVKARDGMTPYGAAKRMVELWAKEYESAYNLPLIINRPGTIYGPGQEGSEDSGWIAWFTKARAEGLPVVINGDGHQIRDLLYVADYVELLLGQIDHFGDYRGRVWDVGGGLRNVVSVRQMAEHLGLDYTFGPPRYGDAEEYVGVNDVPGWRPTTYWRHTETLRE